LETRVRVLYVTFAPSRDPSRARLRALAVRARSEGMLLLVAVTPGSLLSDDASEADDFGIEYVFGTGGRSTALAESLRWRHLLARFRPDLVHVAPDVATRSASIICRVAHGIGVCVAVELDSAPALDSRARSRRRASGERDVFRYATQLICSDSVTAKRWTLAHHVPAARFSILAPRLFDAAGERTRIVAICEVTNRESVAFVLRLIAPLMIARPDIRVSFSARAAAQVALAQLPRDVHARIDVAERATDWREALVGAVCAVVSHEGRIPIEQVGGALAVGVPVISSPRLLHDLGEHRWPGWIVVRQGDSNQGLHAILSLLDGASPPLDATLGGRVEPQDRAAERLCWIYRAILVRDGQWPARVGLAAAPGRT
jgi:hypothetical protein